MHMEPLLVDLCHPQPERRRLGDHVGQSRFTHQADLADIAHCPNCGGELKIIAAIEAPGVIAQILTHLGLPARAPPREPARLLELIHAA